ncbi:MAG: hypothetical protein JNM06_08030 [Blastocatellia bacterium]|nr:hypothetical protein [Blastocatellia bacterium]MBN8723680.1 hypothetical protein [Acidobacteriota bacterium]
MNMKTAKLIGKKLKKHLKKIKKQTGAALAIVSLILLVLTILIISAHYTTIVQTTSSASYRDNTQAFYVAEAGIQRTLDWFIHRYTQEGLQPSPSSPPDWSAIATTDKIPTGTSGQGDALYPNRMGNGNIVILTTSDISNPVATFPIITKTGGPLNGSQVNMLTDFRDYLSQTNDFTSTATTTTSGALRGRYSVTATLLSTKLISGFTGQSQRVERWKITSVGTWANYPTNSTNPNAILASAENVAIIETLTKPELSHAICANKFQFNSGTDVDSYDSGDGPFGGTNQNGTTAIGVFSSTPNTNPDQDFIRGGQTLPGGQFDIPAPPSLNFGCGQPGVACGINFCPDPPPIPAFSLPPFTAGNAPANKGAATAPTYTAMSTPAACSPTCPTAPTTLTTCTACARDIDLGGNTNQKIQLPASATGDYSFWVKNLTGNGGKANLTIDNLTNRNGIGTLNIFVDSLNTNGKDIIVNSNVQNPVHFYVITNFSFGGNAKFNQSENAAGVKVFYIATGERDLAGSGNPEISGLLFAPNATFINNGSPAFYGAIFVDKFHRKGNGSANQNSGVHFDRQLSNNFAKVFSFVPQTQVRRIY